MTPSDYELLLQQERQRNKELEQRVSELTAALEKLRDEQIQLQMKMQLEATLHAKEKQQWQQQKDRHKRSASAPASPHRPVRIRAMKMKLARSRGGKFRSHGANLRTLQRLPEVMRQHVQQQVQQKKRLYASVIENQKTEQATRALQERLRISEPNPGFTMGFGGENSVAFPQIPDQQIEAAASCEDQQKRKQMQHRLQWYLHTQTCRPPDDNNATTYSINKQWECDQLHCATTKKVLEHMDSCTGGMDCTVPLCSSTREVIEHWNGCENDDCLICLPVKQNLQNHTEVLSKTLEALNDGMDVGTSADEQMSGPSTSLLCKSSFASPARRVTFMRIHRGFRRPTEIESESDVGA